MNLGAKARLCNLERDLSAILGSLAKTASNVLINAMPQLPPHMGRIALLEGATPIVGNFITFEDA